MRKFVGSLGASVSACVLTEMDVPELALPASSIALTVYEYQVDGVREVSFQAWASAATVLIVVPLREIR